MGAVDWMKHHSWWLSVPAGLALERLLAYLTSFDLLGSVWQMLGTTGQHLMPYLRAEYALPIWALIVLVTPLLLIVSWLYRERSQLTQSLASVTVELEELKQPKTLAAPILNADQIRVLQAISAEIEKQKGFPSLAALRKETGFSHLVTEGALDALLIKGFMQWTWDRLNVKCATLTPAGRAYLLSPEISSEYWNN